MSVSSESTEIEQLPLPPLVPGIPVLGNALAMKKDLVAFMVEQYRRIGPVFRIRALNQEFVVIAGPEANVFVTQEGTDKFSSYEQWHKYGEEFGAKDTMLSLDGDVHTRMRKLLKPSYSVGNLLSHTSLLVDIAQSVVSQLRVSEEIAALSLIRKIVTEQLGSALINHAPGNDLQHIATAIRVGLNVYVTKQSPMFMLKMPTYQKARQRYLQLGREVLEEHRTTKREEKDLVDNVLAASQQPEFNASLGTEGQLLSAALGPFVAGLDTVANECTFMLYELLTHPDILAQCVEEADHFFSTGLPTQAQLRASGVLHYAMMETLRLHSIAPALNRSAAKDFIFAGHRISKGQQIIIGTTVAHFLPELYPDPYTFDITRYSEERKEHKQRGAYAPFGIGTHLCLGAGAAEAQIVLVIATLLHMVRLEWVNSGTKLRAKIDPTPTLGKAFRVRLVEHRHAISVGE